MRMPDHDDCGSYQQLWWQPGDHDAPGAAHRREPETSILRHAIPEAVRDSYSTSGPSPDRNWPQPLSAVGRPVVPGLVDVSSGRSEEAGGAGRVPDRARTSLVEDS